MQVSQSAFIDSLATVYEQNRQLKTELDFRNEVISQQESEIAQKDEKISEKDKMIDDLMKVDVFARDMLKATNTLDTPKSLTIKQTLGKMIRDIKDSILNHTLTDKITSTIKKIADFIKNNWAVIIAGTIVSSLITMIAGIIGLEIAVLTGNIACTVSIDEYANLYNFV